MSSFNETSSNGMQNSETKCVIQQSEFGNFQETYNWIECVSISFPGKIYFFNLRTRCSTWIRPVSKNVQLRRFNRNSNVYNKNFTSELNDTDMPLMIISSGSGKSTNYGSKTCPALKIVKKSPSNASLNSKATKSSKVIMHSYNNLIKLSSNSHGSSKTNNSSKEKRCRNFNLVTATACKSIEPRIQPTDVTDKQLTGEDNLIKKEREDGIIRNSSIVRCDAIKPSNLPAGKAASKKQEVQPKEGKFKPRPTIREMYGSKTISYDFIDREQLPGVKTTCLSESSVASSLRQPDKPKPIIEDCYEFFGVKSQVNLSSTSSSSTCTCSSFSVSSDTDSNTSSSLSALSLH